MVGGTLAASATSNVAGVRSLAGGAAAGLSVTAASHADVRVAVADREGSGAPNVGAAAGLPDGAARSVVAASVATVSVHIGALVTRRDTLVFNTARAAATVLSSAARFARGAAGFTRRSESVADAAQPGRGAERGRQRSAGAAVFAFAAAREAIARAAAFGACRHAATEGSFRDALSAHTATVRSAGAPAATGLLGTAAVDDFAVEANGAAGPRTRSARDAGAAIATRARVTLVTRAALGSCEATHAAVTTGITHAEPALGADRDAAIATRVTTAAVAFAVAARFAGTAAARADAI